jgi:hypothetical protein
VEDVPLDDSPQHPQGDVDSSLFAGDSPRWRDSNAEHGSEAQRRRDDTPAPTADSEGALDRGIDPDEGSRSDEAPQAND